ncbi:MAG TPA: hypothetical protein VHC20_08320 [Candidatus Paceibacterota bacterium]|nr:hypothetical protein [Candidatus Paceibacterota bacterium]
MAPGQDEKSAGLAICRIKMDAQSQQPSKRGCTWFGNDNAAARDTMPPVVVEQDRKDAILMNRHGPVRDGLLVEVGSIDWVGVRSQELSCEFSYSTRAQLVTEFRNRRQKMSSGKDDS